MTEKQEECAGHLAAGGVQWAQHSQPALLRLHWLAFAATEHLSPTPSICFLGRKRQLTKYCEDPGWELSSFKPPGNQRHVEDAGLLGFGCQIPRSESPVPSSV